MVVEKKSGDMLDADAEALVNTVNCVGVMGKGLALQFKRRFPDMFRDYASACRRGEVQIGRMLVTSVGRLEDPRWVINFPTKQHWRSRSKLEYIDSGLDALKEVIVDYGIKSVAIPPLGAGNGGLYWPDVEALIFSKLADLKDVRVLLFEPSTTRRGIAAPSRIRMSWGRALVISMIERYVQNRQLTEPWEDEHGASHLEIQKLMYFAGLAEPRLKLEFSQGRYGPYSDRVRHLLQDMEGAYTSGFGDGTSQVLTLDPIAPTESGSLEAKEFLSGSEHGHVSDVVDKVMAWIEGFEGPYGVELLASTDWIVRSTQDTHPPAVVSSVQSWTDRKGRIYTEHHILKALEHLQKVGALKSL